MAIGKPPKRRSDTGLIRPYRNRPADFFEVFVRIGWDGIEDHYRTNWRCIRRWVGEEGPALIEARRAATGYGLRKRPVIAKSVLPLRRANARQRTAVKPERGKE